ncbi:MAG: type IV secretion system protein [Pseudomonadota bacterium]
MASFNLFSDLFNKIDASIINVVNTGSSNMIGLISPLMAVCFSIYVMLILFSYMRGSNDEAIMDFFTRMITWAVIITFGINITYYSSYVVPFFTGLGDDLAKAINSGSSTPNALDGLINSYLDAVVKIFQEASGWEQTIYAGIIIILLSITALASFGIAGGYILLAKILLSLVLAIGPLFIAMALFPATRSYFGLWVGQCVNFVLMSVLFTFICNIQISFMTNIVPKDLDITALFKAILTGITFILIDFYIPTLAASLSGGVTIVSNHKKARRAGQAAYQGIKAARQFFSGKPQTGGSISPGSTGAESKGSNT